MSSVAELTQRLAEPPPQSVVDEIASAVAQMKQEYDTRLFDFHYREDRGEDGSPWVFIDKFERGSDAWQQVIGRARFEHWTEHFTGITRAGVTVEGSPVTFRDEIKEKVFDILYQHYFAGESEDDVEAYWDDNFPQFDELVQDTTSNYVS